MSPCNNPCAQKYHAARGRGLHECQTQNLGIELLARIEVTNRNAEMNDASGLDHAALPVASYRVNSASGRSIRDKQLR